MYISKIHCKMQYITEYQDVKAIFKSDTKILKQQHFEDKAKIKKFAKLHKSPLLIANIVKGAVSSLRPFLATGSP